MMNAKQMSVKVKPMCYRVLMLLVILCLNAMFPSEGYAGITSSINSSKGVVGQPLVLTVSVDGKTDGEPDFSSLERNFEVRGMQKSFQNSWVNGKTNSVKQWHITIIPKREGKITIPVFKLGNETSKSIVLEVFSSSSAAAYAVGNQNSANVKVQSADGSGKRDVFIESFTNTKKVWVDSQILYNVRLYYAGRIENAVWPLPQIVDALVEPLGEDLSFQDVRNGKTYNVVERRYAIFPQKSGKFEIPESQFSGTMFQQSFNPLEDMMWSFGMGTGGVLLNGGKSEPVEAFAPSIVLDVMPRPKNVTPDEWLVAYDVKMTEELSPSSLKIKENESLTWKVKIVAVGLLAQQLPDVLDVKLDGFKLYPSKPKKENLSDDKGVRGVWEQSLVLIPLKTGVFQLPRISLKWWNVNTAKFEEQVFPAKQIEVIPLENVSAGIGQPPVDTMSKEDLQNLDTVSNQKPDMQNLTNLNLQKESAAQNSDYRKIIITLIIMLLVLVLILVLGYFKLVKKAPKQSLRQSKHNTLSGLEKVLLNPATKPKQMVEALMKWSCSFWDTNPPINITEIALRLKNDKLKQEFEALNRVIYAEEKDKNFNADNLWELLKESLKQKEKNDRKVKPLPDLYPW